MQASPPRTLRRNHQGQRAKKRRKNSYTVANDSKSKQKEKRQQRGVATKKYTLYLALYITANLGTLYVLIHFQ